MEDFLEEVASELYLQERQGLERKEGNPGLFRQRAQAGKQHGGQ